MRIGELARRSGLKATTIRFYEGRGLLPEPSRDASGYRSYSDDSIEALRFVVTPSGLVYTRARRPGTGRQGRYRGAQVEVAAPWPGVVQAVMVAVGDSVQEEDDLLALESMKMITSVPAPAPGRVVAIHVSVGDVVAAGARLVTLER